MPAQSRPWEYRFASWSAGRQNFQAQEDTVSRVDQLWRGPDAHPLHALGRVRGRRPHHGRPIEYSARHVYADLEPKWDRAPSLPRGVAKEAAYGHSVHRVAEAAVAPRVPSAASPRSAL